MIIAPHRTLYRNLVGSFVHTAVTSGVKFLDKVLFHIRYQVSANLPNDNHL